MYTAGHSLRAKVRRQLHNWWSAGASLEVLRWIREGVRMDWAAEPPANFHQGRSFANCSPAERKFVQEEVQRLLESGAIREAQPGEKVCVSKAFLVPKGTKFRMIWDGRHLNGFTRQRSFKFETLKSLRTLARKGDWMLQVDLADGFHALGIFEGHQRYMSWQCAVTGKTYVYQVLPFGWKLSPYCFCRAMDTLTRVLRSPDVSVAGRGTAEELLAAIKREFAESRHLAGRPRSSPASWEAVQRIRLLPYMDDLLALFQSRDDALRGAVQMRATLRFLGLSPNERKCVWEPTQELVHLGLLVSTRRGLFLVPQEKESKLASFARGLIVQAKRNRRLIPRRQLAVFTGLAQSVYLAVPLSQLYLRSLHDCGAQGRDWACNVRLSRQAIRDLQWWADLSSHNLGRAIWRSPVQATLHSDASTFAWGGVLDGRLLAHGLWTTAERKHHITVLELMAVTRNLKAFNAGRRLAFKTIHLHEDNQAVVYILRRKTSRSAVLMAELRRLWAFVDEQEIRLQSISYVRSEDNIADAPSRLTGSDSWRLRASLFQELDEAWGPHTVDRFASASNYLVPRFNSLHEDPLAEAIDCFSEDWTEEKNWLHPPIGCLDQVAQFLREQPSAATVIVPRWPSYPWFQALRELACDVRELGPASDAADAEYLKRFALRGPGQWPLVAFRVVPGRLARLAF